MEIDRESCSGVRIFWRRVGWRMMLALVNVDEEGKVKRNKARDETGISIVIEIKRDLDLECRLEEFAPNRIARVSRKATQPTLV